MGVAKRDARPAGPLGEEMRKLGRSFWKRWASISPRKTVVRGGITYALDCRELIDCDIYLGGWEPDTIACLRRHVREGMTVLEVGANVGAHTLILAQLAGGPGRVHAVEPTDFAKTKLERTLSLNPALAGRVTLHQCMISAEIKARGAARIKCSWQRGPDAGGGAEDVALPVRTIDALLREVSGGRVDFIKIDVDGYDLKALQGAAGTLARARPAVFVEICNWALARHGQSGRELLAFMQSLGYTGYQARAPHAALDAAAIDAMPAGGGIDGLFLP